MRKKQPKMGEKGWDKAIDAVKVRNAHHEELKRQAQIAIEDLLQDRDVLITTTLADMEELETLIQGHIEGLQDDIEAGRR